MKPLQNAVPNAVFDNYSGPKLTPIAGKGLFVVPSGLDVSSMMKNSLTVCDITFWQKVICPSHTTLQPNLTQKLETGRNS